LGITLRSQRRRVICDLARQAGVQVRRRSTAARADTGRKDPGL